MNADETRAELQRLKESLPTTADGVTVVPGMAVWYFNRYGGSPIRWSRVRSVSSDMWEEYGGGQPHYIRDEGEPYFSTEQLAKEHHAKRLRAIADRAEAELT